MASRPPRLPRFLGTGAAVGIVVALLVALIGRDVPYVNGLEEYLIFAVIGAGAGVAVGALAFLVADRPRLGS
ncbi:hypothetical protein SGUI_2522 [Serinicoccus hydrothermalis]|uniref:Uncharacterized protein n=1 Tax=Serinicoccus hydrothermalis TaxID=1758689 RepID=A0A1B1NEQ0_9MICO|nr:hypothetical protein [Serinicoccus hydrothermalis]ANS79918.1 hypothetical protein SGUI_2522 [Serinicoccus hydrothermalis]